MMRVVWIVFALAAVCGAAMPTFADAAEYKVVLGNSRLAIPATWKALAKWVESRGGHLVYSGRDDPTTVLTFQLPLADPVSHSLQGYADCGTIDTRSMVPISLLRIELSGATGKTLVQFMAFFEEFPLETMHRVICTSTGKLEAEAFAVVK
jgi:hypothetical protein